MCDTLVALPTVTANKEMVFGKNSDRQRNEAEAVEVVAGCENAEGDTVRCTYLTLPQTRRTYDVLLCRPFWSWGAEMASNSRGVVIGNEAVHAKRPPPQTPALTGMDLVRLCVERAGTAREAVDVLTTLLSRYGQGGNCGHLDPSYYNNSFLVADPTEAYVVETVERDWMVEQVSGQRTISNAFSIAHPSVTSDALPDLIRSSAWGEPETMGYAATLIDPNREHIGQAQARQIRSSAILERQSGYIDVSVAMSALRDHGTTDPDWRPKADSPRTICMHAGNDAHSGQSTGSLVSQVGAKASVHWVTGTAAPCLSIFKPVLFDVPLPEHGPTPTGRCDFNTMWWRHEQFHRGAIASSFAELLDAFAVERDALELEFRSRVAEILHSDQRAERNAVIEACWREAQATQERWMQRIEPARSPDRDTYSNTWRAMSVKADCLP